MQLSCPASAMFLTFEPAAPEQRKPCSQETKTGHCSELSFLLYLPASCSRGAFSEWHEGQSTDQRTAHTLPTHTCCGLGRHMPGAVMGSSTGLN